MESEEFNIYSFYRFFNHKQKTQSKKKLDIFLSNKSVRGTILLANEGINGTIAGSKKELNDTISFIRKTLRIRNLNIKINQSSNIPFNRMKVRLKKEIVSLGKGYLNVNRNSAQLVNPEDWNKIITDKDTTIIDVRNQFEVEIGKFKNARNPKTISFRDFPKQLEQMKLRKDKKIAMYCTGGIRCEKASAYMKASGYSNIVQLNGGIINYLSHKNENNSKNYWRGECFVFDSRVSINKKLTKGKYIQCFGCRRPITQKDTLSKKYIKGVCCSYCNNERNEKQKNRSRVRQNQIEEAKRNNRYNVFLKN